MKRADLGIGTSEQHMFFILYVSITDITDWRSAIGRNCLFNSKSVYTQPESGSVAKDAMGKIQQRVWREADALGPQEMNRKAVTYHHWCGNLLN
eukprot:181056-Pelagomonas_calceolata.AAC.1